MKNQVKQLTHGLLTASIMGCGVTSEVATHQPHAALAVATRPAPVGEQLPQAPGRPAAAQVPAAHPRASTETVVAVATARHKGPLPVARPAATPSASTTAPAIGASNRRIQSGRILDEAGEPLVGATVLLQGTGRGTSTDANGDYSLPVPLGTNTFVFAYSGYQDEVAQSRDGQPLTVTLLPTPGWVPAAPAPKTRSHQPRLHGRKEPR